MLFTPFQDGGGEGRGEKGLQKRKQTKQQKYPLSEVFGDPEW